MTLISFMHPDVSTEKPGSFCWQASPDEVRVSGKFIIHSVLNLTPITKTKRTFTLPNTEYTAIVRKFMAFTFDQL